MEIQKTFKACSHWSVSVKNTDRFWACRFFLNRHGKKLSRLARNAQFEQTDIAPIFSQTAHSDWLISFNGCGCVLLSLLLVCCWVNLRSPTTTSRNIFFLFAAMESVMEAIDCNAMSWQEFLIECVRNIPALWSKYDRDYYDNKNVKPNGWKEVASSMRSAGFTYIKGLETSL